MFGWLKSTGKVAAKVLPFAAPFIPFGGVVAGVVKAATGAHLIPGIGSKIPGLAPGEWAGVESAVFGIGGRVLGIFGPGVGLSFYIKDDEFRAGINQCIAVVFEAVKGLL